MACSTKFLCLFSALSFISSAASAAIVQFDLQGQAGSGLLPGNELAAVVGGGTGGEVGGGITFDDVTKVLTLNVGWGSGQGFTDLSGDATAES